MDSRYQLDSGDRFAGRADYLRIDNAELTPDDAAEQIIRTFGLWTLGSAG